MHLIASAKDSSYRCCRNKDLFHLGPYQYFLTLVGLVLGALAVTANPSSFVPHSYQSPVTMTTKINNKNNAQDSTVLRELKETIRKQSAEIDALKKRLGNDSASIKQGKPRRTSSAGHGGGAEVSEEDISQYLSQSFVNIAVHRVGWLGLFLMSLSLTALIMNGFEHTLARQIELAYFVPLLAGHGGNTGGQAVGTVLSALSAGVVRLKDAPVVIAKEALAGVFAGCLLGSIVAPIIHLGMGISSHVSTVVFFTIPLVSTIAATLGSSIPFLCVALGLDPSVIASPAMTSFVDVSGLMSYFLIANQVFRYFGVDL